MTNEQGKKTGFVARYNDDRGFGFIECDDAHPDVFCHIESTVGTGFRRLINGQRVQYFVVQTDRGPQARQVMLLDEHGNAHPVPTLREFKADLKPDGDLKPAPAPLHLDTETAASEHAINGQRAYILRALEKIQELSRKLGSMEIRRLAANVELIIEWPESAEAKAYTNEAAQKI